ncbi:multidrug resistance protein 3 [Streptococcus pneumoniae]|nr:multidrug resistance protein 3 [Streptococcus pneumoniae]
MILLAILFTCFSVYLELEVPTYISKITDLLGSQGTNLDELWQPASMMMGMPFLAFLSVVAVGFFASRVAASYTSRLRSDIFNRVLDYSQTEIKKFSIPSLLMRTTNDITQVQMLITMDLQVVTCGPIMAIWAIGKILGHSEYWLWAVLVAVIVNVLMTTVLMTLAFPKQSLIQGLTDKLNSITRESLTGIRVVRAYNAEDYQNEKFAAVNDELTRLNLFVNRLMAILNPISFKAETGQTVAFIGSTGSGKSTLVNLIPRFYDVSAGEILVDGVNVQDYDFSATAHAGQKVAIVGPTGTGKTTIVNLLMKFYEIDKGSIHIDGVDTKAMTRSEVHDAFSMVLQDTWLFEGTIRDNLIYNQIGISDERMMEASKAVGIHHFIMTLPDGYDIILDDTVTLSVGQKQLLTIARALLKDAPLLILDEATSSVDTRTEELIQKAMDRLMEGRTSFVIAHRLSTIRNADLILVMKDGNIIEQGNYEELMAQGGFYADLYNSQFTEDEAEE